MNQKQVVGLQPIDLYNPYNNKRLELPTVYALCDNKQLQLRSAHAKRDTYNLSMKMWHFADYFSSRDRSYFKGLDVPELIKERHQKNLCERFGLKHLDLSSCAYGRWYANYVYKHTQTGALYFCEVKLLGEQCTNHNVFKKWEANRRLGELPIFRYKGILSFSVCKFNAKLISKTNDIIKVGEWCLDEDKQIFANTEKNTWSVPFLITQLPLYRQELRPAVGYCIHDGLEANNNEIMNKNLILL